MGGDGGLVAKSCRTLATPWTVAHQAPPSMAFSRQEYWSGVPFPSPTTVEGGSDVCPMADCPHLPPWTLSEQQLLQMEGGGYRQKQHSQL